MRITPRVLLLAATVWPAVVPLAGVAEAQAPPPARVGSVPTAAPAAALAAGDGYLVVGVGSRLHVIDVSRPASPEPVGDYDLEQPVLGLAAVGDAVYVANSHDGLRRLDLSDPSAPRLAGTSATRGQAVGVAVSGTHAFVGDNSLGFDIVEAAGDLQRVGEYLGDGFPRGIAAGGPLVFVADQPAGLIVVDASVPTAPAVAGSLSLGRDPITQVFVPDSAFHRRRGARVDLHHQRPRRAPGGRRLRAGRAGRDRAHSRSPAGSPAQRCGTDLVYAAERRWTAGVRSDRSRPASARWDS